MTTSELASQVREYINNTHPNDSELKAFFQEVVNSGVLKGHMIQPKGPKGLRVYATPDASEKIGILAPDETAEVIGKVETVDGRKPRLKIRFATAGGRSVEGYIYLQFADKTTTFKIADGGVEKKPAVPVNWAEIGTHLPNKPTIKDGVITAIKELIEKVKGLRELAQARGKTKALNDGLMKIAVEWGAPRDTSDPSQFIDGKIDGLEKELPFGDPSGIELRNEIQALEEQIKQFDALTLLIQNLPYDGIKKAGSVEAALKLVENLQWFSDLSKVDMESVRNIVKAYYDKNKEKGSEQQAFGNVLAMPLPGGKWAVLVKKGGKYEPLSFEEKKVVGVSQEQGGSRVEIKFDHGKPIFLDPETGEKDEYITLYIGDAQNYIVQAKQEQGGKYSFRVRIKKLGTEENDATGNLVPVEGRVVKELGNYSIIQFSRFQNGPDTIVVQTRGLPAGQGPKVMRFINKGTSLERRFATGPIEIQGDTGIIAMSGEYNDDLTFFQFKLDALDEDGNFKLQEIIRQLGEKSLSKDTPLPGGYKPVELLTDPIIAKEEGGVPLYKYFWRNHLSDGFSEFSPRKLGTEAKMAIVTFEGMDAFFDEKDGQLYIIQGGNFGYYLVFPVNKPDSLKLIDKESGTFLQDVPVHTIEALRSVVSSTGDYAVLAGKQGNETFVFIYSKEGRIHQIIPVEKLQGPVPIGKSNYVLVHDNKSIYYIFHKELNPNPFIFALEGRRSNQAPTVTEISGTPFYSVHFPDIDQVAIFDAKDGKIITYGGKYFVTKNEKNIITIDSKQYSLDSVALLDSGMTLPDGFELVQLPFRSNPAVGKRKSDGGIHFFTYSIGQDGGYTGFTDITQAPPTEVLTPGCKVGEYTRINDSNGGIYLYKSGGTLKKVDYSGGKSNYYFPFIVSQYDNPSNIELIGQDGSLLEKGSSYSLSLSGLVVYTGSGVDYVVDPVKKTLLFSCTEPPKKIEPHGMVINHGKCQFWFILDSLNKDYAALLNILTFHSRPEVFVLPNSNERFYKIKTYGSDQSVMYQIFNGETGKLINFGKKGSLVDSDITFENNVFTIGAAKYSIDGKPQNTIDQSVGGIVITIKGDFDEVTAEGARVKEQGNYLVITQGLKRIVCDKQLTILKSDSYYIDSLNGLYIKKKEFRGYTFYKWAYGGREWQVFTNNGLLVDVTSKEKFLVVNHEFVLDSTSLELYTGHPGAWSSTEQVLASDGTIVSIVSQGKAKNKHEKYFIYQKGNKHTLIFNESEYEIEESGKEEISGLGLLNKDNPHILKVTFPQNGYVLIDNGQPVYYNLFLSVTYNPSEKTYTAGRVTLKMPDGHLQITEVNKFITNFSDLGFDLSYSKHGEVDHLTSNPPGSEKVNQRLTIGDWTYFKVMKTDERSYHIVALRKNSVSFLIYSATNKDVPPETALQKLGINVPTGITFQDIK